jgi:hypothetical protein
MTMMIAKVKKRSHILSNQSGRMLKKTIFFTEGISSDEDEIDELGPSYYERVANLAAKKGAEEGLQITASVRDGEDDSEG